MRTKSPGLRLAAWLVAGAAAWAAAGYWLSGSDATEAWMYRIGLTSAALIPLIFVGVYTAIGLGLYGNAPAAWWKDEIGTALVVAALTLVPIAGPLAWVLWYQNGELTQSWLAWVEVSGPLVSALAWLRLCWIWVRLSHKGAG